MENLFKHKNNVYNVTFENLVVNTQACFFHNVASFRLRIKGKSYKWLSLPLTLLLPG